MAHQEPGRRSRYYHSQIDMEMLLSGMSYDNLSDSYVIFVCNYDPFGKEKYRYTFDMICHEDSGLLLEDGSHTVVLSTEGQNQEEVPRELVQFLKFVKADLKESAEDFEDAFVSRLQAMVEQIKKDREMGERYMIFEEMLREERTQGRAEGKVEGKAEAILELLEDLGHVSQALHDRIMEEKNLEKLKGLHKMAARADSLEEFLEKADLKILKS